MQQTKSTSLQRSPIFLIALLWTCGAYRKEKLAENDQLGPTEYVISPAGSAQKEFTSNSTEEVLVLGDLKILVAHIAPVVKLYRCEPETTMKKNGLDTIAADKGRTLFSEIGKEPGETVFGITMGSIEKMIQDILKKTRPRDATHDKPYYAQSFAHLVASVLWLVLERAQRILVKSEGILLEYFSSEVRWPSAAEAITWFYVHFYLQQDIADLFNQNSGATKKVEANIVWTELFPKVPMHALFPAVIFFSYEEMMFTLKLGYSGRQKTITALECLFKAPRGATIGLYRLALIKALRKDKFAERKMGKMGDAFDLKAIMDHVRISIVGEENTTDAIKDYLCPSSPSPSFFENNMWFQNLVGYLSCKS